jgi:hypothetical protein
VLALLSMASVQQVAAQTQSATGELVAQDARLARVAERLLAGNAWLCRQTMPLAGLVFHSRDQYSAEAAKGLFANGPVEIALVLPGSPAERAGLRAGDALAAIGAIRTTDLRREGEAPLRDAVFDTLAAAWPGPTEGAGPLPLSIFRDGAERQVLLEPAAGCRALVEIRTRDSLTARSDGRVIQLDYGLVAAAADDELAVIFAHELAHSVLEHRRRLEAAGVAKGFFGEFGRNQRLNRQVEVEADRLSIHLLANAGYDPQLAPTFWRGRLAKRAAGGLNLSTTYPSNETRAELLEREIADYLPTRAGPTLPGHLLARRDMPFPP